MFSEGIVAPSSLSIAYVDNASTLDAICGKSRCCCHRHRCGFFFFFFFFLFIIIFFFFFFLFFLFFLLLFFFFFFHCFFFSHHHLPPSIFAILDDECNIPKGADDNIAPAIGKLALQLAAISTAAASYKPVLSVGKMGGGKFTVGHYAGDVS